MDLAVWVLLAVFAFGALLAVIEYRIMKKPYILRTDRERRFLAADRSLAREYNRVGQVVGPVLVFIMGAAVAWSSTIFWTFARGEAIGLIVAGAAIALGSVGFWFYLRRLNSREWRLKQAQVIQAADVAGRPRWFGRPRVGVVVGVIFMFGGLLSVSIAIGSDRPAMSWTLAILQTLVGIAITVASVVQLRRERE